MTNFQNIRTYGLIYLSPIALKYLYKVKLETLFTFYIFEKKDSDNLTILCIKTSFVHFFFFIVALLCLYIIFYFVLSFSIVLGNFSSFLFDSSSTVLMY